MPETGQPARVCLVSTCLQARGGAAPAAPRSLSLDSLLEEYECGEDPVDPDPSEPRYIAEESPSRIGATSGAVAPPGRAGRWSSTMSSEELEAFVGQTLVAAASERQVAPAGGDAGPTVAVPGTGQAPLATSVVPVSGAGAAPNSPVPSSLSVRHMEAGSRVALAAFAPQWSPPASPAPSPVTAAIRLDLAQALPEPELGTNENPTVGSALHRFGTCKPCAFLFTKGCVNAAQCPFCHLCDAGEKKRRQKEKKDQRRDIQHRWLAESLTGAFSPALPAALLPGMPGALPTGVPALPGIAAHPR